MEEQYKIINGFSNYEISNFGNVKNVKTGRILKQSTNRKGYKIVGITSDENGKSFSKRVHRLVAEMFIPNLNNKNEVDHLDNNRANNIINNLRWASSFENCRNRILSINNTSGSKGISFEQNKWRSLITHNNKRIHLGYFDNKEDAITARVNKAKELFGDFINKCEKLPEELELEELDKELTKIING